MNSLDFIGLLKRVGLIRIDRQLDLINKPFFIRIETMTTQTLPKIHVRNSVAECAQSLKKENAGKYHNYSIKDCTASIAASKIQA